MTQDLAAGLDDAALALGTATLHEAAGRTGALPATIRPVRAGMGLAGPALTVRCPSGDNLWLHRAIYRARPGEVIVCDVGDEPEYGYWGEVMVVASVVRGIAGLVINGGVRDSGRFDTYAFPAFTATVSIRGTGKNPAGDGAIGVPITIGDVEIRPGDLVVGDADGVVVLPAESASRVLSAGRERERKEQDVFARLRAGETTIDIYDLPREEP